MARSSRSRPSSSKVNESIAVGYIAARTVESILILVGVVSLMSVVALRQDVAVDAVNNSGALVDVARGLLAVHDETRLLGPQFCAGLGNGILLGYLMWRSRLLPRPLVMVGLIGGPLALLAGIGVLLGAWDTTSGLPVALTAPEGIWELAQCLAPPQRLPALTNPHRPAGTPEPGKLTTAIQLGGRSGAHLRRQDAGRDP